MKSLEDDIYSFGFILLESLIGPMVSSRREAFLQNEMVFIKSPAHHIYYVYVTLKHHELMNKNIIFLCGKSY